MNKSDEIINFDQQHVWHPYSAMDSDLAVYPVESANGVRITLTDGRVLVVCDSRL